jgi:hypothetical protein
MIGRRSIVASRRSWEMHYGSIPDGMFVCHHCDNRVCVRPDHLFLGTAADNSADMAAKGRSVGFPGELSPAARLTEAIVCEARRRAAAGERIRDLAREFGIDNGSMSRAVTGRRWAHLPGALSVGQVYGKRHPNSKLTPEQVAEIKSLRDELTGIELARRFGVSTAAISSIFVGRTWRDASNGPS